MAKTNTSARKVRSGKSQTEFMTFRGAMAPKSWLLTGTALKIGLFAGLGSVVALPTPALADCAGTTSIACGSGTAPFVITTPVTASDTLIEVIPGGDAGGIEINNAGNTTNFVVLLDGALSPFVASKIEADATHIGLGLTTAGTIKVTTAVDTSVSGGSGKHDGMRLRALNTGTITLDLSGDIMAGASKSEAIDAQAAGGKVDIHLKDGTYTGKGSQTIVAGSKGTGSAEVDVTVDKSVDITGGTTGSTDHGIWVLNSKDAEVDFDGTLTATKGTGIVVGYDGTSGTSADKVNLTIKGDGSVTGLTGFVINSHISGSTYDVGDVKVTNLGHIEGTVSEGGSIHTAGKITVENHSYGSLVGTTTGLTVTGNSYYLNNFEGLIAGLNSDGLDVLNIIGAGGLTDGDAVQITNHGYYDNKGTTPYQTGDDTNYGGGVIVGFGNGLNIDTVSLGNVTIRNNGYTDTSDGSHFVNGGLIAGWDGDAVNVNKVVAGGLFIDNSNTIAALSKIDLTSPNLDAKVASALSPLLLGPSNTFPGGYSAGIWGGNNGVDAENVNNAVKINNNSGVIVGYKDDGIYVYKNTVGATGVDGFDPSEVVAFVLNNGITSEDVTKNGGVVWGGESAVDLNTLTGSASISNHGGTIFGVGAGVTVDGLTNGNVVISNGDDVSHGLIQGLAGDGININNVKNKAGTGGAVNIYNNTGSIFGDGHAIKVANSDTVTISNGANYTDFSSISDIIGEGGTKTAVIELSGIGKTAVANITNNAGSIIGSTNLPHVSDTTTVADITNANPIPSWSISNHGAIYGDFNALGYYVFNGAPLTNQTALLAYKNAEDDLIIKSSAGGATSVNNSGYMFGRITLNGYNGSSGSYVGNTVQNDGVWVVSGASSLLSVAGEAGLDKINNNSLGWIQTAVNSKNDALTTFTADSFSNAGMLSLADGGAGDITRINGDYKGANGKLAIDADLGTAGGYHSDVLQVLGGDISGNTGVVVRLTNEGGAYGAKVTFAHYNSGTDPASSSFVLDASSDHYITMGSTGFIEDGLLAWYVNQDATGSTNNFNLVAGWGPGAYNSVGVVTGAQTAFLDGLDHVQDHDDGDQFGTNGGAGADVPSENDPTSTKYAVWLKGMGDMVTRTSSITVTPPGGAPFDLSSSQSISTFIAGADIVPGGSAFRAGVFGGLVNSTLDFALPGTGVTYQGGTIGAYLSYNDGRLYADGTLKADTLATTYSFAGTSAAGTAVTFGGQANVGYRTTTDMGYYEPVASIVGAFTTVTDTTDIDFGNGTSFRAGAGVRVGKDFKTGDYTIKLSGLAKVWNEFGGPNTTTVTSGGSSLVATDSIGGLYGELSATANITNDAGTMSGFATVGAKVSANSTSYGAKVGARFGF